MKDYGCSVDDIPNTTYARYFSLEEANRALVLVGRIVADIVGGYRRLMDLQETLEAMHSRQSQSECEQIRQQLIRMVERLQGCLGELEDVGVELKDWATGLVDFPSMWHGRAVLLSWQHGEGSVTHWHETGESFATRQPISNLLMEDLAVAGKK